jgi:hypothetical protein
VPSSTGSGGVEKNVAIVYTIEGVDQAAADQERLAGALGETSEALDESSTAASRAEQATERLAQAATEAGQQAILTQQRISALAAGLSGLGSALGSESELGSVIGRMGQLAATGVQMGSIFGPGGAVAGGILGAAIPAIQGLTDALTPAVPAIREVTEEAQRSSGAAIEMGESFVSAGERMRDFLRSVSTAGRRTGLEEINAQITDIADQIERITTRGSVMERLDLPGLRERMLSMSAEAEGLRSGLAAEDEETGAGRRRGGGGRARREEFRSDGGAALRALMVEDPTARFERRGQDAIGFARGLGSDPVAKAQDESLERLADKRKEEHEAQLARIQEEVDAWTSAGQKIGSTLYNAFQTAATGQETLEVAVVKGFKNLAIQFGGQMVNEGIGALLTAVGNTVANPPMAATKAAEGAGKLALGIGLGAVGAAIPVPAAGGGSQASTPRLGPQGSGEGGGSRSVIVNMNAPAVITGSRAAVGREIGGALEDARNRFGRASL